MAKVRNHNTQTRWNNSRHKGSIWSYRTKVKDGKDVVVGIKVPHDTLYDPDLAGYEGDNKWNPRNNMQEPWDALALNWIEELIHWVVNNGYKLERQQTSRGSFLYQAIDNDKVVLSVESEHNVLFEPQSPKRRKRRK